MHKQLEQKFRNTEALTHNMDIKFKYHYSFVGYIKLLAGGTALPKSVDIINKNDHSLIRVVKDEELLNGLGEGR